MDDEILTIYCLCDEFLQSIGHKDHPQCLMSSAEVMTVALIAAINFWWQLCSRSPLVTFATMDALCSQQESLFASFLSSYHYADNSNNPFSFQPLSFLINSSSAVCASTDHRAAIMGNTL